MILNMIFLYDIVLNILLWNQYGPVLETQPRRCGKLGVNGSIMYLTFYDDEMKEYIMCYMKLIIVLEHQYAFMGIFDHFYGLL